MIFAFIIRKKLRKKEWQLMPIELVLTIGFVLVGAIFTVIVEILSSRGSKKWRCANNSSCGLHVSIFRTRFSSPYAQIKKKEKKWPCICVFCVFGGSVVEKLCKKENVTINELKSGSRRQKVLMLRRQLAKDLVSPASPQKAKSRWIQFVLCPGVGCVISNQRSLA